MAMEKVRAQGPCSTAAALGLVELLVNQTGAVNVRTEAVQWKRVLADNKVFLSGAE
jgi:hypothetical protein